MTDRLHTARTACLMHGMADRLGVDPMGMADCGALAADDLDAMVSRCRQCTKADACIVWMVERSHADAAPGYCLNGEDLAALPR